MSRAHAAADLVRPQARPLKMPGLARAFEGLARQAREEGWTHEEYLYEVLAAELTSRADSAIKQRLHAARFPEHKPIDSFDFAVADGIDAKLVLELARGDWIARAENVLLAGPIGTGKTHLAIALRIEAARQRRHVAFWRAADLVRALIEARDARELSRLQRRLARIQLLIVDELGFIPFDRAGGELLFNLLAARYEKGSVIVTTNQQYYITCNERFDFDVGSDYRGAGLTGCWGVDAWVGRGGRRCRPYSWLRRRQSRRTERRIGSDCPRAGRSSSSTYLRG